MEYEQALRRFKETMDRNWAIWLGRLDEAVRLDRGPSSDATQAAKDNDAILMATVLAARGDHDAARARLGDLPDRLRRATRVDWVQLGFVEALMGGKEEAIRCARKAEAQSGRTSIPLARLYAWAGEKDAALAVYAELLPTASGPTSLATGVNVNLMRTHPEFFPLQGDPRFQALLNDPKNNAPLF